MGSDSIQYVSSTSDVKVVLLDYKDLADETVDLGASIKEAFGFNGLGILAVRGVPGIEVTREDLLPLAHKFANLPEEVKEKTVHKASTYSFGWSHGKEFMSEGKPDFSKGSYYNNPIYDKPIEDEELVKRYPSAYHPNIWPEDLPELRDSFRNTGKLVVDTGLLLAKHIDKYVHSLLPSYPKDRLYNIIRDSKCCKARLLHYFPLENAEHEREADLSSWCGWHNDHGSLTGLVPAMYINKDGKQVPNPDPKSGLYVQSRNGKEIKAAVPSDCLAFQIGETACVHSGGLLQATPHAVRAATGPASYGISRETFAVFMEPNMDEPMNIPDGSKPEDVILGSSAEFLPKGVPVLEKRWNNNERMDFGEFTDRTLKSYYSF